MASADSRVFGRMGWPFLRDMCQVVYDIARLQNRFGEEDESLFECKCRDKGKSSADSMLKGNKACYSHKINSIQLVNELRRQSGEELLYVNAEGVCEEYNLVPCARVLRDDSPSAAEDDIHGTTLVPHSCTSCFENIPHLPLAMTDMTCGVYHTSQTLEQYMSQMLHALGAGFPCVHCRPEFANVFRHLYCHPEEMPSSSNSPMNNALRIQTCLQRILTLNEPKPMPLTKLRPNADGVHFLWIAQNLVNARLGSKLHEEYWLTHFSTHYENAHSTPEHAWKVIIVMASALYTKYDRVDGSFVNYQQEKMIRAGATIALRTADAILPGQMEAHQRFLKHFVCDKPNLTEFHDSYQRYNVHSARNKEEAMSDYLYQSYKSLVIERNMHDESMQSASVASYESAHANRTALPHFLEACCVLQAHSPTYRSMSRYLWPIPPTLLNLSSHPSAPPMHEDQIDDGDASTTVLIDSAGRKSTINADGSVKRTSITERNLLSDEDALVKWLIFREFQWYQENRDVEVLLRNLLDDANTNVVESELTAEEARWLYDNYDVMVVEGDDDEYAHWIKRYTHARLEHYRTLLV